MDAFLAKLSYHATSFAIRSCIALTSKYLYQQGSRLIRVIDDDPLRRELALLQKRLVRKIELISPILESIENHYNCGNAALETVVRTTREIQDDIDLLVKRLESAVPAQNEAFEEQRTSSTNHIAFHRRVELESIIDESRQLLTSIDDAIPLLTLWVSHFGGNQTPAVSPISPARSFQASMLLNVGDMQYVLNPTKPMQVGPDFTLSVYMLFQAHASCQQDEEPYGTGDGQRKPLWQEVMHKARLRLYRMPPHTKQISHSPHIDYTYELHFVEDLDDGRVHIFEDDETKPQPYDNLLCAGMREAIPVGQISKVFYADVGRILNIPHEDGSSAPVLLLKRSISPLEASTESELKPRDSHPSEEQEAMYDNTESVETDDVQRQIHEETLAALTKSEVGGTRPESDRSQPEQNRQPQWKLPKNLDPEWMALEVFTWDNNEDETGSTTDPGESSGLLDGCCDDSPARKDDRGTPNRLSRSSFDSNLTSQFNRMNIGAATVPEESPTSRSIASLSRPSSQDSCPQSNHQNPQTVQTYEPVMAPFAPEIQAVPTGKRGDVLPQSISERQEQQDAISQSPFSAIHTSLSLLEMLIRLTSLQELEQTTHLAVSDDMLRFYLGDAPSTTGFPSPFSHSQPPSTDIPRGAARHQTESRADQRRRTGKADEATGFSHQRQGSWQRTDNVRDLDRRKVGFDPYTD